MDKIKTIFTLILSGTVISAISLWLFSTKGSLDSIKIFIAGLIIILGVFSFFINLKKLTKNKNKLTNH